MLTKEQLQALLANVESDRVERTISTTDTDKFCEAICAFANDLPNSQQPGYLLVGVTPEGHPSGLTITDQLLQNLASHRSNGHVLPIPAMHVQKYGLPGGEIAVVEVQPADMPPVRYKGRVYIRVGPRRGIASEQEERLLSEKRTAQMRTFDAHPCRGCTLNDLVLDLFLVTYRGAAIAREVIEENHRDVKEQLASLRFYDLRADCPTHAGVLLFGKDPLRWIPGAYVQFVRWAGTTMSDEPRDDKRFTGDLLTVLRELQGFLSLPIQTYPVAESALRERTEADYPAVAIRELLWNAVMHRSYESNAPVRFYWYDDRVEIQNPGGLYGMASARNFPRQTDYRNPIIAEAMSTLGYVNAYGRGIVRSQDALRKNGNPPAEFITDEPTHFLVTIQGKR
jgi:ATP-dependent DNA helicase RecG